MVGYDQYIGVTRGSLLKVPQSWETLLMIGRDEWQS